MRPRPAGSDEAALQARVDAFFASAGEDEQPALRTRLRLDPGLRRAACISAVGAGVALFVLASLTTPLAGADTATRHVTRAVPEAHTAPLDVAPTAVAAPAVRRTVPSKPVHVARTAPTDGKAISGLAANGIPTVALNAYRVAAARLAHVDPSCGVDWALLAGIGREESDHGRFGGAVLHADGTSTPAIVGPALDGIHWDYIPVSTEYIRVTGDRTYAHALGPMQFIPTTWAAYGADADGDGKADVFDINDAALGSARYLCAAGGNLRTHAGQVAGVLAYNHSDQYLAQVLALADAYRSGVAVTGIPVGNTTGSLPPIRSGGYVPPANPGAPTAVDEAAQKAAAKKAAAARKAAASKKAAAGSTSASSKPSTGKPSTSTPSTSPAAPSSGSTRPSGGGGQSGSGTPTPSPSKPSTSADPSTSAAPPPTSTCHVDLGSLCL